MKAWKHSVVWLLLAGAVAPIAACDQGPFEEAGEEVDDAVDDAGDAIDRRN